MAFFERAKQTLSEAGKELGQRANEISSTAKFTLKLKEAEKRLNDAYALLGRQIMEENEEAVKDLAPDMVFYIKEKMEEINAIKEQMDEVKNAGKYQCPSCGKLIGTDSRFCEFCGQKVVADPVPAEESIPEEQADEVEIVISDDIVEEASPEEKEEEIPEEYEEVEEKASEQESAQEEEVLVEEMQMKTCPGCGNKIQVNDIFCIYCGMKM